MLIHRQIYSTAKYMYNNVHRHQILEILEARDTEFANKRGKGETFKKREGKAPFGVRSCCSAWHVMFWHGSHGRHGSLGIWILPNVMLRSFIDDYCNERC